MSIYRLHNDENESRQLNTETIMLPNAQISPVPSLTPNMPQRHQAQQFPCQETSCSPYRLWICQNHEKSQKL